MTQRLLTAAWIAPMDAPLIRDGAILIENQRIAAVGNRRALRATHRDAIVEDLPDAIILPGLVNAHAHLELSDLHQPPKPASFVDWIMDLMRQAFVDPELLPQKVRHAVEIGVRQSLRFGVTAIGDISKQCRHTRPALRDGPLRIVSYGEIQAMAQRRGLLEERFAAAADLSCESSHLIVGLTPHAPYTVEPPGFQRCLEFCRRHHRPLATHLAENSEESIFLAEQTGPFRHLWEAGVNAWDDHVPPFAGGPIRFAREMGLLDFPTLLAHVNYCDDEELAILAAGKASVVYCPRTHAYFGHPPHRWRDMLAVGINVAVGTDSCASSPDLNLVDDLRLLHKLAPEFEVMELWRLATIRAARAIGMENQIGSITAGKQADLAAFAVPAGNCTDPLSVILESQAVPVAVWIAGQKINRHPPHSAL